MTSTKTNNEIKAYFCPKCRSVDVRMLFAFRNVFGMIPRWRCNKCCYENMTFPIMVYKNKLRKRRRK